MSRWVKLGAKPADIPYVNFYAKKLAEAGWSAADIDTAISFGLKHASEGWAKFEGLAIHEMHKRGIDGIVVNEALTPGDIILEQPAVRDALEAQSFAEAHAAGPQSPQTSADGRLAEIQRMIAEDPDAYFRDPLLVREHEALLQTKAGEPTDYRPPSPTERRLGEIRRMMSEDGRSYWNNPDVQAEHLQLIQSAEAAQGVADEG